MRRLVLVLALIAAIGAAGSSPAVGFSERNFANHHLAFLRGVVAGSRVGTHAPYRGGRLVLGAADTMVDWLDAHHPTDCQYRNGGKTYFVSVRMVRWTMRRFLATHNPYYINAATDYVGKASRNGLRLIKSC